MGPERWQHVKSLFEAALGREVAERERFLNDACAGDEALRAEVASLLGFHDRADSFIEHSTIPDSGDLTGRGVGPYEIVRELGRGAMGVVYLARQVSLDRRVALKVLPARGTAGPTDTGRFRREALAVARLHHPNIVTIFDFDVEEGLGVYLVMEYLEGRSLRDEIDARGRIEPREAVAWMGQIAAAVESAHQAGIIHRDLKPANIFLESAKDGPVPKVLDFGVAKMRAADAADDTLTKPGTIIGTPLYMSPEQCRGLQLDARSDVYALGCVLYEMLAGSPPFAGPSVAAVLAMHATERPKPPGAFMAGLPPALDAAVLRALAKDPDARFQTAVALARSLERALPDAAGTASAAFSDAETPPTTAETLDERGAGDTLSEAEPAAPPGPNNLPEAVTPFVGRDREVGEVGALVARHRLVTLCGAGGIGKTRLALRVAAAALRRFPGGAWLVDLTQLGDPSQVVQEVARVLGVREEPGRSLLVSVCDALRATRLLVVLDNCEHLVVACAELVAAVLRACPEVRFLVTSRETLGLDGEATVFVPVLSVPDEGRPLTPDDALAYDAVRLFVARARLRNNDFALDSDNVASVVALCRQLEGIPLAIELAAARTGVLGVSQILSRMGDRFRLLAGSSRARHGRRHTLRAALDWSHDLLEEDERVLFRHLSVFAGGWTLDAAYGVVGPLSVVRRLPPAVGLDELLEEATTDDGQRTTDILEGLSRLVDKSLVIAEEHGGAGRYRMLETIREFAREKLVEAGEEDAFFARHSEWYLRLAERGRWSIETPGESDRWLDAVEADFANVLAVLRRALRDGNRPDLVARLLEDLGGFWETRSRYGEALLWIRRGLETLDATPEHAVNILSWAGTFAFRLDKLDLAREYWERELADRRAAGRRELTSTALANLAMVFDSLGDRDRAEAHTAEALEISRASGDRARIGIHALNLGTVVSNRGDQERAMSLMEEARAIGEELEYARLVAATLVNMAHTASRQNDWDRSEELAAKALAIATDLADSYMIAAATFHLGAAATTRGEYARAESLLVAAIEGFHALSTHHFIPPIFEELARLAERRGAPRRALELLGAAAALRRSLPVPLPPADERYVEHLFDLARSAVPAAEAESLLAEGGAMTLAEAVRFAVVGGL
jgi:predicted ATPase/serine/threonine protein kinase